LAGLFTADDFLKPIELEIGGAKMKSTLIGQILLYNKRMILISCGKHTLGVFKNYGEVFMYNANHKAGMQTFRRASVPELIDAIFRAYKNAPTHHAPFGFRIFTGADTQAFYPEQAELLAAIAGPNSSLSEQATRTHSAIHIAARIGATESLRYYLGNNAEIDSYSKARRTPLYVAAAKGHLPAVALIMEFGADMHKLCRHDKTPFIRAAENNHLDIVEYMLGNQSSSTFKDLIIALTHLPNVASRQQLIHRAKPGKVEKFLVKSKQESLTFFAKASKVSAEVKVRRKIMQPQ
jgi:hypothetical protein